MPTCIFPKEEILFLRSCSWVGAFTHAICNYMMTWLSLSNMYIPLFSFWSSKLPSAASFSCLKVVQPFWHVALLCHHTIILLSNGSHKVEWSTRHLLLPSRGEPSNEDSNGGSWLSSSYKCSFLMMMMYDELFLSSIMLDDFLSPYILLMLSMRLPRATFFLWSM